MGIRLSEDATAGLCYRSNYSYITSRLGFFSLTTASGNQAEKALLYYARLLPFLPLFRYLRTQYCIYSIFTHYSLSVFHRKIHTGFSRPLDPLFISNSFFKSHDSCDLKKPSVLGKYALFRSLIFRRF